MLGHLGCHRNGDALLLRAAVKIVQNSVDRDMRAKINLACGVQTVDKFLNIMLCLLRLFLPEQQRKILHMMPEIMAHGLGCHGVFPRGGKLPLQVLHILADQLHPRLGALGLDRAEYDPENGNENHRGRAEQHGIHGVARIAHDECDQQGKHK